MSFAQTKLKVKQVPNYFNKLFWSDPGWEKQQGTGRHSKFIQCEVSFPLTFFFLAGASDAVTIK